MNMLTALFGEVDTKKTAGKVMHIILAIALVGVLVVAIVLGIMIYVLSHIHI